MERQELSAVAARGGKLLSRPSYVNITFHLTSLHSEKQIAPVTHHDAVFKIDVIDP